MVAKYFCQNKHNYTEVNHIDGDKTNNHPQNLEWVTRSENLKHAYKLGLRPRKTKATESNKKKCFVKIKETDEILEFESMTQASYYFNKAQTWAHGVVRCGGETKKYKVWQWAKEVG